MSATCGRRLAGIVIDWMRYLLKEGSPLAQTLHMDRVVASWDAGVERICRGAPHVIVTHAPESERTAPAASYTAIPPTVVLREATVGPES